MGSTTFKLHIFCVIWFSFFNCIRFIKNDICSIFAEEVTFSRVIVYGIVQHQNVVNESPLKVQIFFFEVYYGLLLYWRGSKTWLKNKLIHLPEQIANWCIPYFSAVPNTPHASLWSWQLKNVLLYTFHYKPKVFAQLETRRKFLW